MILSVKERSDFIQGSEKYNKEKRRQLHVLHLQYGTYDNDHATMLPQP